MGKNERLPITVIVPVLNEEARVAPLVASLRRHGDVEVIVADGGSGDATVPRAGDAGAKVVHSRSGRAAQMNAGAAAAGREILLFLHADTILPEGFSALVEEATAGEGVVGGCFRFALSEGTPFFRFITATANFRSRRMGIVFGDQAIFVRRTDFAALGGYAEEPLMEDCDLVRRLRRRGPFVFLDAPAVTSTRTWRRAGPLRNTLVNVLITWAWVAGVPPSRLARWRDAAAGKGGRTEGRAPSARLAAPAARRAGGGRPPEGGG